MENKQIKQLTPEQIKMLVRTSQERKGGAKPSTGKMERNSEGTYTLSKAQERLWFLSHMSEGLPLYNSPMVIRVQSDSEMDLETLKLAMQDIADRHDILRTTFHLLNDRMIQKIHPNCNIPVTYRDLRALPGEERENEVLKEAKEHGNFYFNTEDLPLFRFHVLRTDDKEYIYLVNAHHLLTDGWTTAMIAMELPSLYQARVEMVQPSLPPVNRQYIDYVQYEQDWMKSAEFTSQLAFWKNQFKEIPPPFSHLYDAPRTKNTTYQGGRIAVRVPGADKQKILDFCKSNNSTPFQYLVNALAILLYRYTGQADFVIGIPVANRNNIHFQYTFGPFINTLPIPFHCNGNQLLRDFLATSGETVQQAIRNQAIPYATLIEELNPSRDNTLFQVHFAYQVFPQLSQKGALSFVPVGVDYAYSKFDLNIWLEDDGDDWLISVTYLKDLFKPETVLSLMERYARLITVMSGQLDSPVRSLDFILPGDLSVIPAEPLTGEKLKRHWLRNFEDTCLKYPTRIAVIDKYLSLSYEELYRQADHLARHLSASGTTRGTITGICLERCADMIVSIVALFKLNAAYLPIDPGTPPERLSFIVQDSGIQRLICSSKTAGEFETSGMKLFLPETLKNQPAPVVDLVTSNFDPENLAYIIYTSGTTGNPKGVKIRHKSLINYTEAIWERMQLSEGDCFANVSTISADLGNTSIYPALAYGGMLSIVPEDCVTDAVNMAAFYALHPADCLKIVPSHLLALLDSDSGHGILPRKLLILGGETCRVGLIKKIREIAPGLRILNHYGPTETTIGALTYEVSVNAFDWETLGSIPIGKPLAHNCVELLDPFLQPVAKGAYGEICLGGANLSAGYLNRPELETERFIADPVHSGERLYRTGDFGKMLPGGNIVYQGRMDRQVKIRGYRVELAEVEHALNACVSVQQAVVLPPGDLHGTAGLSAIIVPREAASVATVKEEASKKLRSPFLPDKFVVANHIPVTSNGKIDYKELRRLADDQKVATGSSVLPRDFIELGLVEIWKQVLQSQEIGVEDDFFESGGHSLMAIKLLSLISEKFGVRLPLTVLFEHNTIASLARAIRNNPLSAMPSPAIVLQSSRSKNKIFFVHPAGGHVMTYYPVAKLLRDQWQVIGIQSTDYSMKHDNSIAELADYYLKEIIGTIDAGSEVIFAGWSMGATIALEMAGRFHKITGRAPGLVIIDQPSPEIDISEKSKGSKDKTDRVVVFGKKVNQLVGKDLGISQERIAGMTDAEISRLFMQKFGEVKLLPEGIQEADFHGFLELMMRHSEITTAYVPGEFRGPALIIKAGDRLEVEGWYNHEIFGSADLGWSPWISNLTVKTVISNHMTIMNSEHAPALAEAISNWVRTLKEAYIDLI